jgi:hypothetical protein
MNEYGITQPKFQKDFSKNTKDDPRKFSDENEYVDFTSEEDMPRSVMVPKSRKCRPYSSVKYNRKVDRE